MKVSPSALSHLVFKDPVDRINGGVGWDRIVRDETYVFSCIELYPRGSMDGCNAQRFYQLYVAGDLKSVSSLLLPY